ncbi:MAG: hypothetical protein SFT94_01035 [Pseudanabaenaceae cyanobacterium bins.68]|nr:hypothetical protein [Pseudanabaenaceae cyanobacterium bins.68]
MDFQLDLASKLSPEQQLVNQLLVFQELGMLDQASQLPTPASLAAKLGLEQGQVEAAYQAWQQQGLTRFLAPIVQQAFQAGYSKTQLDQAIAQIWQDLTET